MKSNKFITLILIVVFLITCGMFFYQNFYAKKILEANQVTAYVATKDIYEGGEINATNIGAIKIDKNKAFSSYALDVDAIIGKKAKSTILKDEIININRIADDDSKLSNEMFSVKLKANYMSNIKKGDNIRVCVAIYDKKQNKTTTLNLFTIKEVKDVYYAKKNNSGAEAIESFEIHCSDEEAVNYYNAIKVGEIIALKFNDITEENQMPLAQFEANSPVLQEIGIEYIYINPQGDATDIVDLINQPTPVVPDIPAIPAFPEADYGDEVSYVAHEGDTWETIAITYDVTVEQLLINNPDVTEILPGTVINISSL